MKYGKKRYNKMYSKNVSKAVKHYVNKQIAKNTENKMIVYDASGEFNSLSTTWTELNLTDIDQGTSVIERIGRQIKLKSLEVDMVIKAGDTNNILRVIIGLFSGQMTTPLATGTQGLSTAITKNTCEGLIKKYYDKYVVLDGVRQDMAHVKYFKKFKKPIYITWSSDAASQDKHLFMSILSDSSAVTHPSSPVGRVLLRFEDA